MFQSWIEQQALAVRSDSAMSFDWRPSNGTDATREFAARAE
jgi:hypothetical protein